MKSTVEIVEKNRVKLTLVADKDEFQKALQNAYVKTRGRYNVPGFRKGKAPRALIERHYGEGAFFERAVDDLYPVGYSSALKEHDLKVVGSPELDLTSISKEDGLVMTATVYLVPEVELGKYMGLTVTIPPKKSVTDEEVNATIEAARERVARFVEVERPVQSGDTLTMNFEGFVDGVAFEGGRGEDQTLTIGSNRFIPGFEDQLIGLTRDIEHEITVTFPEEYHEESLAAKEAVFKVTITGIKEKQLPDIDDEFAIDVSEFDTLDEYKADIMAKLTKEKERQYDIALENQVIKAAVENADIDLPPPMVQSQLDRLVTSTVYRMAMQGYDYQAIMNNEEFMTKLHGDLRGQAEASVKTMLLIEKIVEVEAQEVPADELEKALAERAEAREVELEEFKKNLSDEERDSIEYEIKAKHVIDKMKESADIIESESAEEDADNSFMGLADDIMDGLDMLYDGDDDDYDDGYDDDDFDDDDDNK